MQLRRINWYSLLSCYFNNSSYTYLFQFWKYWVTVFTGEAILFSFRYAITKQKHKYKNNLLTIYLQRHTSAIGRVSSGKVALVLSVVSLIAGSICLACFYFLSMQRPSLCNSCLISLKAFDKGFLRKPCGNPYMHYQLGHTDQTYPIRRHLSTYFDLKK